MSNILVDSISKIGIELSENQVDELNKYYEMLIEKNKVMNLTAITEYEDVVIKHFADSLAVINAFPINNAESIIDVGTGAGFPGMVLKIAFPNIKNITLLDSLNKRINFLNDIIEELGLQGINGIHGRAEEYARQKDYRGIFDVCVSRAVANLAILSEYCLPFVKKGGYFIAYKASDCIDEVNEAKKAIFLLGGKITDTISYTIPDTDITRVFVVIKKVSDTSNKYPRKAGLPSKEPLK